MGVRALQMSYGKDIIVGDQTVIQDGYKVVYNSNSEINSLYIEREN